jgi:hypothetical protein
LDFAEERNQEMKSEEIIKRKRERKKTKQFGF